jgi:hypothetical protein
MDHRITTHRFLQEVSLSTGLTNDEACRRRQKFGPNAVSDTPSARGVDPILDADSMDDRKRRDKEKKAGNA